mgnify:CR=1 FL=1
MKKQKIGYAEAGVDYESLDPAKTHALASLMLKMASSLAVALLKNCLIPKRYLNEAGCASCSQMKNRQADPVLVGL